MVPLWLGVGGGGVLGMRGEDLQFGKYCEFL